MYQLAVFDLDGTIAYTIEDIAISLNVALEKNGFPSLTQQQTEAIVGRSTDYMCRQALPESERDAHSAAVHAAFEEHYTKHSCDHTVPYEGAIRTLQRLKNAGVKLAVVSNKPHKFTVRMVERLFPGNMFSMTLGMMDKFRKKPDPDPLDFVISYLNIEKKNVVYIGDSDIDIEFARNAGIDCISCTWGYRTRQQLKEAGAVKYVDDFSELTDLIL